MFKITFDIKIWEFSILSGILPLPIPPLLYPKINEKGKYDIFNHSSWLISSIKNWLNNSEGWWHLKMSGQILELPDMVIFIIVQVSMAVCSLEYCPYVKSVWHSAKREEMLLFMVVWTQKWRMMLQRAVGISEHS